MPESARQESAHERKGYTAAIDHSAGLPLHIDTTTEIAAYAAAIVYGSGIFALPDLDFMYLQTGSRHL